ncbi:septum formation protein [Catalinimonas alkaloidigena]|uniref:Nucleoside triphosphate pyrophosphatase n=1 Tax=Catalinimonas alkaloidigena TaxID=1075417 RepID=A0A1G9RFI1_9BACT|nr:septum formation protein [Catalinimonas alkaloidigena]
MVKDTDESFPATLPPAEVAEFLARQKADAFTEAEIAEAILITADTVVVLDTQVLNKPADPHVAFQMLSQLSGRVHEVYTGVCLRKNGKIVSFTDRTRVHFKTFEPTEINFYIEHYMPFDKAGAYGAQDWLGLVGIERIEGSYFNVMGLPTHRLYTALKEF